LKGADDVIIRFLKKHLNTDEIIEKSSDFAKIGLRTLAFAYRELSEEEFQEFLKEFNKENNSKSMPLIEKNMDFLGKF
jgi:magnesium-transporting ATPase (P-type)